MTGTQPRQRTNLAGMRARQAERRLEQSRAASTQAEAELRDYMARRVQQQGRTPQRDAMRAQADFMRGIGIQL